MASMSDADILRRIQAEQRPWVAHNFGDRPSWMPLLGIVEEAGELCDAEDQRNLNDISDALADIMIFALDYCSGMGWDAGDLWNRPAGENRAGFWGILRFLGKLCHAHLKDAQGIRVSEDHKAAGQKALAGLFANLRAKDAHLVERVVQTWQEVRKRDWKADPATAAPAPEPNTYEMPQTTLVKARALVELDERGPVEPPKVETPITVVPPSKDPEPKHEDTIEDFLGILDLR